LKGIFDGDGDAAREKYRALRVSPRGPHHPLLRSSGGLRLGDG